MRSEIATVTTPLPAVTYNPSATGLINKTGNARRNLPHTLIVALLAARRNRNIPPVYCDHVKSPDSCCRLRNILPCVRTLGRKDR
jgi:hypothetical protein